MVLPLLMYSKAYPGTRNEPPMRTFKFGPWVLVWFTSRVWWVAGLNDFRPAKYEFVMRALYPSLYPKKAGR